MIHFLDNISWCVIFAEFSGSIELIMGDTGRFRQCGSGFIIDTPAVDTVEESACPGAWKNTSGWAKFPAVCHFKVKIRD